VVNLVVLWNTIYMDAAVDQLGAEGHEVRPEGVARLSPLGFKHVNMLGRYAFTLPDTVARGELRPLRVITQGVGRRGWREAERSVRAPPLRGTL
jgi:hypothetical protein